MFSENIDESTTLKIIPNYSFNHMIYGLNPDNVDQKMTQTYILDNSANIYKSNTIYTNFAKDPYNSPEIPLLYYPQHFLDCNYNIASTYN